MSMPSVSNTLNRLGYGCAGLMRPSSEADRQALLVAALDAGIRYFDVARYYGHGQAEGVLGRFIAKTGCRDQISIATKFGMDPPGISASSSGRFLMNVARRIASLHPGVRSLISARASGGIRKNCFDVANAKSSLETSLRELKTDRIDLLLLHEATLEDSQTEGLVDFLEGAKSSGKILAYGLGSDFSLVGPIITSNPQVTRILQFSNGLGNWNRRQLPVDDSPRQVNTHGSLKCLPRLIAKLNSISGATLEKWSRVGAPSGDELAGMLMGLAIHDNPNGVTLFSSTNPDRVRSNVEQVVRQASISSDDWHSFEQAAEAVLAADS